MTFQRMNKGIKGLLFTAIFSICLVSFVFAVETKAKRVRTETGNFDRNLSASDDNVQKSLETLEEVTAGIGIYSSALTVSAGQTEASVNFENMKGAIHKIGFKYLELTGDDTLGCKKTVVAGDVYYFSGPGVPGFNQFRLYDRTIEGFKVIYVGGENSKLDFKEDGGAELTAILSSGTYMPTALASEVATQLASTGDGNTTASYSKTTRKITISRTGTFLDLLWNTGTNSITSCAAALEFDNSADDTGSLSYLADTAHSGGWTDDTLYKNFIYPQNVDGTMTAAVELNHTVGVDTKFTVYIHLIE